MQADLLPDKHLRVNSSKSLPIPRRLAPLVLENHIGQWNRANRPEPTYRVADRQQRIGSEAGSINRL